MKIKINILVFVLVVATFLGGCNMKKAFKNQEEAQEYVLSCMEQKYGETFIITDEGDYNNDGQLSMGILIHVRWLPKMHLRNQQKFWYVNQEALRIIGLFIILKIA